MTFGSPDLSCPELEALRALREGALDEERRDALLGHLANCPACRDRFAAQYDEASQLDARVVTLARTGSQLGSRYTLRTAIGEGAWGEVWSAWDEQLRRDVAVKLLRSQLSDNPADYYRVVREAETLARLRHRAVVPVYDSGEFGGRPYLVMALIDGTPLPQYLQDHDPSEATIVALFAAVGSGVAAAHRAAIVHRDLKPENLLVDRGGEIHVTDFGLATRLSTEQTLRDSPTEPTSLLDLRLTPTRGCVGTPAYLAPELLMGHPATPASDQFALCVSMVEALTRSRFVQLDDVLRGGIPRSALHRRLRGVSSLWRPVLARGLDPEPELRYPDVEALFAALRRRMRWRSARQVGIGLIGVAAIVGVASFAAHRARIADCMPEATALTRAEAVSSVAAESRVALDELRAAVTEYQDERLRAYADVCTSASGRPREGRAAERSKFFCLEGARVKEDVVAALIVEGDLRPALYLAGRLPPLRECNELSDDQVTAYGRAADTGTELRSAFSRVQARELLQDTREELERLLDAVDPSSALAAEILVAIGAQAANRRVPDAQGYFERALATAMLCGNRGATLTSLLGLLQFDDISPERASLLLGLAQPLARAQGRLPEFFSRRAAVHVRQAELDEALSDIELALGGNEATTKIDVLRSELLDVSLLQTRATIETQQGNLESALDSARQAASQQLELGGPDSAYAMTVAQLAGYAEAVGRHQEALDSYREAGRLFEAQGNLALSLRSRVERSRQELALLRWDAAKTNLETTTDKATVAGLGDIVTVAAAQRAYMHALAGDWEQWSQACEQGQRAASSSFGPQHVRTLELVAFCAYGSRGIEDAAKVLGEVVQWLEPQHADRPLPHQATSQNALFWARFNAARVALDTGNFVDANAHAMAAQAWAPELDLQVPLLLAEVLVRQGHVDQGHDKVQASLRATREHQRREQTTPVELASDLIRASAVLAITCDDEERVRRLQVEARDHLESAGLRQRAARIPVGCRS